MDALLKVSAKKAVKAQKDISIRGIKRCERGRQTMLFT
jgi:hypothetical protein